MPDYTDYVNADPRLQALRDRLADQVSAHLANGYALDPLLIIALISLAVQIIMHCREKRSEEAVRNDLKKWPRVFGFQALRARKEIKYLLQRNNVFGANLSAATDAVFAVGQTLTDQEIDGLLAAACR
jgi:mannitol-1-phosphate/altronate dehydrogenase